MKTYRFTCAKVTEDGEIVPLDGIITPAVSANTPTEAMNHETIIRFCEEHECRIYRMVT